MLVSIIIPLYNYEQYIRDCLESCVRQTYKNIEVVVVDDCSTDKSFESLVDLLRRLARLNKGKFLAFGDTRRMVEQLVMALKRSPSEEDDKDENNDHKNCIKLF